MKILVINPGSTSTKIAIFRDEEPIYSESISHEPADLAPYKTVLDQLDYRKHMILAALDKAGYQIADLDAISARGGFTKPVAAQKWEQNLQEKPQQSVLFFAKRGPDSTNRMKKNQLCQSATE